MCAGFLSPGMAATLITVLHRSRAELAKVLEKLGEDVSEAKLDKIVSEVDRDNDGELSWYVQRKKRLQLGNHGPTRVDCAAFWTVRCACPHSM